jgi:hypothetical protein
VLVDKRNSLLCNPFYRKSDRKGRFARLTVNLDLATVSESDLLAEIQSDPVQSCRAALGCEPRLEYFAQKVVGDTTTIIFNGNPDLLLIKPGTYSNMAFTGCRNGFISIMEEI